MQGLLKSVVYKQCQLTMHFSVFPCWPAALVLPKANQFLQTSVQPYISSILEALMEPTSRGFSEVRDVFFRELVEISKNSVNGEGKEKLTDVSHALLSTLKLHSFDFGIKIPQQADNPSLLLLYKGG